MGFWAEKYNEFSWGQQVISKFYWIFSLVLQTTILIKIFNAPNWVYYILYLFSPVIIILVVWRIGAKFNLKLRKPYLKEHFKDFDFNKEEKDAR